MKVYFHDSLPTDPRLPHTSPSLPAVPSTLLPTLGVLASHHPTLATVDDLARERSYANRDEITVSPEKMGAVYEDKIKMFFQEHLHEDEEIRYILDGAGYFDVRWGEGHRGREVVRDVLRKGKIDGEGEEKEGEGEGWVRIRLEKGDLIVLPAGIYHRFMVDEGDYIHAMRLFKEEPKWTPLNRGPQVDENPYRKEYLAGSSMAVEGIGA